MNRDETITILAVIKTAYPSFYKDSTDIDSAIDLWSVMFADDTPQDVTEAVRALICISKFPPSIAEIKEKIVRISRPQQMSEMEAWNLVLQAIQDSNYHAQKRFDSLPEVIRKVIGSANQLREWAALDRDSVNTVLQSNFMRSYKVHVKNENELALMPRSTLEYIKEKNIKMLE